MKSKLLLALASLTLTSFAFACEEKPSANCATEKKEVAKESCGSCCEAAAKPEAKKECAEPAAAEEAKK